MQKLNIASENYLFKPWEESIAISSCSGISGLSLKTTSLGFFGLPWALGQSKRLMLERSSHPRFFSSSIYGVDGPILFGSTSNKRKYTKLPPPFPPLQRLRIALVETRLQSPPPLPPTHGATSTALTKPTSIPENSISCALGTAICTSVCANQAVGPHS